MTNRISRLKTALFANTREISLERALLYTASHRQPARRLLHAGIVYRFCSRPVGIGGWRDARRSFCRRTAGRRRLVTHAGPGRTRANSGTEVSQ